MKIKDNNIKLKLNEIKRVRLSTGNIVIGKLVNYNGNKRFKVDDIFYYPEIIEEIL